MLTREMIYTALTGQKQKVFVLHQRPATDIQKLSSEQFSAAATRLTNLFRAPKPIRVGSFFLEDRPIHITGRYEAVRSKSEIIIANLLHTKNVAYFYEYPLKIEGITKYPDFTIEDDDTGSTYYWEHCGMLRDPAYNRRWQEKKPWYRANGILPQSEGGGKKGTLIFSEDQPDGGLNAAAIADLLKIIKGS